MLSDFRVLESYTNTDEHGSGKCFRLVNSEGQPALVCIGQDDLDAAPAGTNVNHALEDKVNKIIKERYGG